jgi:hypothetical protein
MLILVFEDLDNVLIIVDDLGWFGGVAILFLNIEVLD